MVRIDRIYTRGGDAGETSIGSGLRVSKLHPRIIAGGAVDELNCAIGVAISQGPDALVAERLRRLQQLLFDLGADLCTPWQSSPDEPDRCPRMQESHVGMLESIIDEQTQHLAPLQSFIIPGGTPAAAAVHLARSIARRAEIEVLRLAEFDAVNPQLRICLNRISDLLFVLARIANGNGRMDVLWIPGTSGQPYEEPQSSPGDSL